MAFPRRLLALLPSSIGAQCVLGLLLGVAVSVALGSKAAVLTPLGQIFLRSSQIAVMPYLICELVVSLGSLQPAAMRLLSRSGSVVLAAILASGALVVLLLPALLPELTSSSFFSPDILQPPVQPDLVGTYLPFNIFTALADDNLPAVVLFAAVLGVLAQGLPRRQLLLEPLDQLRLLFRRLNKLVARMAPIGIVGLTADTLTSVSPDLLVRSQAFLVLNLVALVLLFVLGFTAIVVLTPLDLAASWRILRGPLAITASSANLLIALPLLNDSLSEEMARFVPDADPTRRQKAMDEISALMPVGFALPNLGQVVSLLFLPFAAWFVDRPLDPSAILTMLATGIPAVTGGIKSAVRMELQQLGLPANLIGLVQLNGEWLYRQEKVLSLLGLAVLVILVVSASLGVLRFRPRQLLSGGALLALLALVLGGGGRALLTRNLASTYRNDKLLLSRRTTEPAVALQVVACRRMVRAAVGMDALQSRRILRVGLRADQPPWAFRNRSGQIVGYDVDLAKAFARHIGVRLQVCEAPLSELQALLSQQRLDLAIGGIKDLPLRSLKFLVSGGYQKVHLALLTSDAQVPMLQNLAKAPLGRPLRLAAVDRELITPALRDQIAEKLGSPGSPAAVTIQAIPSADLFLKAHPRYDALLTTAEGGASWAVLHPSWTMLPLFGPSMPSRLVVLVGGFDRGFLDFVDDWLARQESRGRLKDLFRHWVQVSGPLHQLS
ncbi:MAG: C4-dicarboxylate transport protein [Cyanobacteriota bacterium]|jgi:Na+/H+-dicarboxylate symporter/ABC-type amino acid transport substrate-binding protein